MKSDTFSVGDKVGVPILKLFPGRAHTRSVYGYDVGEIIATGRNKKTGLPAIKVRVQTSSSTWAKKVTEEPILEKWALCSDCDKM